MASFCLEGRMTVVKHWNIVENLQQNLFMLLLLAVDPSSPPSAFPRPPAFAFP